MILWIFLMLQAQSPGAVLDGQIDQLQQQVSALEASASARFVVTASVADQFDAVQQACPDDAWVCPIAIAPGTYEVDRPIVISRSVDVDAYGAELRFTDSHGVVLTKDAVASSWRGGRILGANTSTSVVPRPMGVALRGAYQSLVDVNVQGFAHGVDIVCSNVPQPDLAAAGFEFLEGHCNSWRLDRVTVSSALLSGVRVQGRDANAGSAVSVASQVNCQWAHAILGAPDYSDPGAGAMCANIFDQSFLGNTWVAPHSAHALDTERWPADYPDAEYAGERIRWFQYLSTSSNGRTTWVGAYAENGVDSGETGNGPSMLSGYGHQVVGGISNIRVDDGWRVSERGVMSQARFTSSLGDRSSTLYLGGSGGLGSPWAITTSDGLNLRLMPTAPGLWELETKRASGWLLGELGTDGVWRQHARSLLPTCTSTAGVTWGSYDGVLVREDDDGVGLCATQ